MPCHPIPVLTRCLCTQDETAVARAAAKLGGLPSSHRVLLLLDNAEDCLQGQDAVSFGKLLVKVRASCTTAGACPLVIPF